MRVSLRPNRKPARPDEDQSRLMMPGRRAFAELRNAMFRRSVLFSVSGVSISWTSASADRVGSLPIWFLPVSQTRSMTRHRRVQDRSKNKRVRDLEIATELWKIVSKINVIMDVLKNEPEQVIPMRRLEQYRQKLNLSGKYRIKDFVLKSPKLFELYRDKVGVTWCGLTEQAEDLIEEEARLLEENSENAVEHVTRLLMMSVDKRLCIDQIAHFRRDMGLPYDFRNRWIHMFPEHFKVVKIEDKEYLQLTSWNPSWAVTELEKKAMGAGIISELPPEPGFLSLRFPLNFPPKCKVYRHVEPIEKFQTRTYLSPYADARELVPGSQEFDKRAVAVMHEILSFTIEKRLVTDHLTHFRREFVMPQKLMRLLLKHFGIFYVSERGKRFSVFLKEAYDRSELIEKCPLVQWKEKVLRLTGYRVNRKINKSSSDFSDSEDGLIGNNDEREIISIDSEDNRSLGVIDDACITDDSEMDISEINDAYGD